MIEISSANLERQLILSKNYETVVSIVKANKPDNGSALPQNVIDEIAFLIIDEWESDETLLSVYQQFSPYHKHVTGGNVVSWIEMTPAGQLILVVRHGSGLDGRFAHYVNECLIYWDNSLKMWMLSKYSADRDEFVKPRCYSSLENAIDFAHKWCRDLDKLRHDINRQIDKGLIQAPRVVFNFYAQKVLRQKSEFDLAFAMCDAALIAAKTLPDIIV